MILIETVKTVALRFKHYPYEIAIAIIKLFASVGITLLFWWIVAETNSDTLEKSYISYYFLIAINMSFLMFGVLQLGKHTADKIKQGELNTHLIRPANTMAMLIGEHIGERIHGYLINILIIVVTATVYGLSFGWWIPAFLLSLMIGLGIGLLINILIASISFFLTEVHSIRMSIYFIIKILSGLIVPLSFLGSSARNYLLMTPLPNLIHTPTVLLLEQNITTEIIISLISGTLWLLALFLLARLVWQKGLRSYAGVGI
ncbi:ABC-2 family transporter protein [Candidatus Saccharibacteria bacterium]|nr:ABC-2 family transporter protein [Candidatus Saccharibacteria bacterium]